MCKNYELTEIVKTEGSKKSFYPTPQDLADRLVSGLPWEEISYVLEPSAGKGDLVERLVEVCCNNGNREKIVDCVEIDPYLRQILCYKFSEERKEELSEKISGLKRKTYYDHKLNKITGLSAKEESELKALELELKKLDASTVRVVHDDFLTFETRKQYDLIVMNPPFADGDAHLLKALEMQSKSGGMIRCLLNAETILKPYTNRRKVLKQKLDELGAEVDFVNGGFLDAERKTGVTVALIKISIPKPACESSIFDRLKKAAKMEDPHIDEITDLALSDYVKRILSQYNLEVDAGLELIREYMGLQPYIRKSFDETSNHTMQLVVGDHNRYYGENPNCNQYLHLVRLKYWEELLNKKEIIGKLTSNLQEKYQSMVGEMAGYDFTLFNIRRILVEMNAEMTVGIQMTILAMFDKLSNEHSWYPETKKNIHYYNGWKSNRVHKVNKKVIVPTCGIFSNYSWRKTFEVYEAERVLSDIEKVFNYLDGNMTAEVNLYRALQRACEEGRTKNIQCKFFDVTFYKKGTMHIKFYNQELLDRFNIYVARNRNWLPPSYGRKTYENMDSEERTVIDNFQGKAAYDKILENQGYYLAEPTKQQLMIC